MIKRITVFAGVVAFGVVREAIGETEDGQPVRQIQFMEETGEEVHIRLTQQGIEDLISTLSASRVVVAPATALTDLRSHNGG